MTPKKDLGIHTRAMLVYLTLSLWDARKYDKAVTADTNAKHGASADAGRYNKHLFGGPVQSHLEVCKQGNYLRQLHYQNTLAWRDDGWRLVTTANYQAYVDTIRKQGGLFLSALDTFIDELPDLILAAKPKLNGMWSIEDYPTQQAARSKFAYAVEYDALPATGDFRLDLAPDQADIIRDSVLKTHQSAIETAMTDACTRAYAAMDKIVTSLSDPSKIFRDSLIENARELCGVLPKLNIANDAQLNEHLAKLSEALAQVQPDDLRINPRAAAAVQKRAKSARKTVAADVSKILDSMKDIYGELSTAEKEVS